MGVAESETTGGSTVPVGALIPQPHGGALRNGGTNKGGPGAPRTSLRHLYKDKLSKPAAKQLERILNGEAFLKDLDGKEMPLSYAVILGAIKEVNEVSLGSDSIPEALLVANVRLISRLHELFPDVVTRPLTQGEMAYFGDLLEQDLGQARVVRPSG